MAGRRTRRAPQKTGCGRPAGSLLLLLGWSSLWPPAAAGAECSTPASFAPMRSQELDATGELPWMVPLQDLQGKHLAFGSLLGERWLLSKASGLHNRTQVLALASVRGPLGPRSLLLPIGAIIPHKDFDELTLDHNIALLRVGAPIQFEETVQSICFPYQNFPPEALQDCWVVGWLHPHRGSGSLRKLLVVDADPCPLHRSMATECCSHREGDTVSGCLGHPGNSVVCQAQGTGQWVLKGVLTEGGARCFGPFLYTRVAYYSDWIVATTARWGSPVFPIPLRGHLAFQAEHRQEMMGPFLDQEQEEEEEEELSAWEPLSASEDLLGLNGTEWLNASGQGPIEARAKSAPLYYDYYGGETYPISTATAGQMPWGVGGISLLAACSAVWVAGRPAEASLLAFPWRFLGSN